MGTTRFALTADDVVETQQALFRAALFSWKALFWFAAQLLVIIVLVAIVVSTARGMPLPAASIGAVLIIPIAAVAFQAVHYFLLLPGRARRQFAGTAAAQGEIELSWNKDQIGLSTDSGNAISRWSDFSRFAETPRMLLLMKPQSQVTVVPKAALDEAGIAEIRGHLARHGVTAASFRNA